MKLAWQSEDFNTTLHPKELMGWDGKLERLRKVERQIEAASKQSKTDYEDFDAVKSIIENISI